MREIDADTWLMVSLAWTHGMLFGWAIWRWPLRKNKHEVSE